MKRWFFLIIFVVFLAISLALIVQPEAIFLGLGQNLLIGLILIIVTAYFTKHVIEYKNAVRWGKIKTKVMGELNLELSGLFTDIVMICNFDSAFFADINASDAEIEETMNQRKIQQMKEFSENDNLEINETYKPLLIEGNFGVLFDNRREYLSQFELKYIEFLEADVILKIIDIQKFLHRIDQDIVIRNKQVNNNWLRLDTDVDVLSRARDNFNEILKCLNFLNEHNIFTYR